MATEYIEKQAARPDEFCVGVSCQECPFLKDPLYGGCRVDDFIMALPPADVRPVVRGRWIVHYDDIWPTESTQECSECHEEVPLLIDCKFCPNCTAEMEVDEDG